MVLAIKRLATCLTALRVRLFQNIRGINFLEQILILGCIIVIIYILLKFLTLHVFPICLQGRSRHHKSNDDPKQSHRLEETRLDKTSRLSSTALAAYAGSIPSPRLNKDFQLPHHNGNDVTASSHLGMPGNTNSTLQVRTLLKEKWLQRIV